MTIDLSETREYPRPLMLFSKQELIDAFGFLGMEVVPKSDIYMINNEKLYVKRLAGEPGYMDYVKESAAHSLVAVMLHNETVSFETFDSRELLHTGNRIIKSTVKVVRMK